MVANMENIDDSRSTSASERSEEAATGKRKTRRSIEIKKESPTKKPKPSEISEQDGPYQLGGNSCCLVEDHCNSKGKQGEKKNCDLNPLCLWGLGEFKMGIWSAARCQLLNNLGDLARFEKRDPKQPAG